MPQDAQGLAVTAASEAAAAAYDGVVEGYLKYRADAGLRLKGLLEQDAEMPMALVLKGAFAMLAYNASHVPRAQQAAMEAARVEISTDGACLGNPGPGGWGALLRMGARERELSGGEPMTTNNRMELMAAIVALETLSRPCDVLLRTDSQYVRQGILEWLPNWVRRNWRTAGGSPVKNQDLWQRLQAASQRHRIEWRWVKGHAGDPDNERADTLARTAAEAFRGSGGKA